MGPMGGFYLGYADSVDWINSCGVTRFQRV